MTENMETVVRNIISDTMHEMVGADIEFSNDESLITGGLLDSFSMVRVVQSLQDKFDIEIMVSDITIENFDSIDLILDFLNLNLQQNWQNFVSAPKIEFNLNYFTERL